MITTLTPNPSLDRTVSLPGELIRGGVNRLTGVTIEPGGKGLNVARVLVGAGQSVTAVLPAASHDANISISPSFCACRAIFCVAGVMMRRVLRATLRPFRISAAMRRSESLPFVQLPIKA